MGTHDRREILRAAREALRTARLGLTDLRGAQPERRLPGLSNAVVFGRAVTNVLQRLRSKEPRFEPWYQERQAEMRGDPLLKYFYDFRSEILKKGTTRASASAFIRDLEMPRDLAKFGPPPLGAKSVFVGDNAGGSGWIIVTSDGEEQKFYVDLPGDIAELTITLRDAPTVHRGVPIRDASAAALVELYLNYLDALLTDAETGFRAPGA